MSNIILDRNGLTWNDLPLTVRDYEDLKATGDFEIWPEAADEISKIQHAAEANENQRD